MRPHIALIAALIVACAPAPAAADPPPRSATQSTDDLRTAGLGIFALALIPTELFYLGWHPLSTAVTDASIYFAGLPLVGPAIAAVDLWVRRPCPPRDGSCDAFATAMTIDAASQVAGLLMALIASAIDAHGRAHATNATHAQSSSWTLGTLGVPGAFGLSLTVHGDLSPR